MFSMFGGIIVLGTATVSGAKGMEWLREMVDPVVMMDVVVHQVVHPLVSAHFIIWYIVTRSWW